MSGGSFEYDCFRISDFAEKLKHKIEINDSDRKDSHGDFIGRHFSAETMDAMNASLDIIVRASHLAREIEWLYSGDHSEESFLKLAKPYLGDK